MTPDAIVGTHGADSVRRAAVERPVRVADAATMVIFGATGDLAKRKLLPALYNLNGDLDQTKYGLQNAGGSPATPNNLSDGRRLPCDRAGGRAY